MTRTSTQTGGCWWCATPSSTSTGCCRCSPRLHDLRHSFAVGTLLDWCRDDADIAARLPLLSAYLGHAAPAHTYWYLQASPELLAEAARRLALASGQPQ